MTIIIAVAAAAVGGFVFGVLFGRKNIKTVEASLAEANKALAAAKALVK
jgi:phosphotransferase system  glucose/maltose/N-acetylglucosamine-specific IIC component